MIIEEEKLSLLESIDLTSINIVIGIADMQEGEVPIAFVVLSEEKKLTESELCQFLTQYIAQYKIPKKIYFIKEMPLTNSGKINHNKLYEYLPV